MSGAELHRLRGGYLAQDFRVGYRVELKRQNEHWRRGNRFGEVLSVGAVAVKLRLEPSREEIWCRPDNIGRIIIPGGGDGRDGGVYG